MRNGGKRDDPLEAMARSLDRLAGGDESGCEFLPFSDIRLGGIARKIEAIVCAFTRENARLREAAVSRTKALIDAYNELQRKSDELGRELAMAGNVQKKFIPSRDELPLRPELSCAARYQAMTKVGGDLYDVIRAGKNAYAFVMADVTGHGVPAALVTAMLKTSFQTKGSYGMKANETLAKVNQELIRALGEAELYATAWLGILDLESGKLRYANAGHPPVIRVSSTGDVTTLGASESFLGAFEDERWSEGAALLKPGDRLILYTDGITETKNPQDDLYGGERLKDFARETRMHPTAEIPDRLFDSVEEFSMGIDQHDDRATMVVDFISPISRGETP